jgi:SAM-dependent methyltransferase
LDFIPQDGILSAHVAGFEFDPVLDIYGFFAKDSSESTMWKPVEKFPSPPIRATNLSEHFDFGLNFSKLFDDQARQIPAHKELIYSPVSKLPFNDKALGTIWAMQFYWAPDLEETLREFHRVLHDLGAIYILAPLLESVSWSIERWNHIPLGTRQVLGGRRAHLQSTARTDVAWRELFGRYGFAVKRDYPVVPRNVFNLYEVGFRPLMNALLALRNSLMDLPNYQFLKKKSQFLDEIHAAFNAFPAESAELGVPTSHRFYLLEKRA